MQSNFLNSTQRRQMDEPRIRLIRSGAGVILEINRPPVNVLDTGSLEEINRCLENLLLAGDFNALLLRGAGRCFSAGMDVADHLPDRVEAMFGALGRLVELMDSIPVPIIAAVHGAALGGALEIVICADMAYAEAGSNLGLPEIKLGVFPPVAAACLGRRIGRKAAAELILRGHTVNADVAVRLGLINEVFAKNDFQDSVNKIFEQICSLSRPALIAAKKSLRHADDHSWKESMSFADHLYLQDLMKTEDALEGLTAFVDKRQPVWKNR